jgi:hypothetical protein
VRPICTIVTATAARAALEGQRGRLNLRGEHPVAFAYKVVEVREKMIGGKMSGDKLERLLNEHGSQGWQLKAITSTEVKGRMGPGGVEGLLVTFERPTQ